MFFHFFFVLCLCAFELTLNWSKNIRNRSLIYTQVKQETNKEYKMFKGTSIFINKKPIYFYFSSYNKAHIIRFSRYKY
jgi:hypothetical protein